jgi:hypothetical protein
MASFCALCSLFFTADLAVAFSETSSKQGLAPSSSATACFISPRMLSNNPVLDLLYSIHGLASSLSSCAELASVKDRSELPRPSMPSHSVPIVYQLLSRENRSSRFHAGLSNRQNPIELLKSVLPFLSPFFVESRRLSYHVTALLYRTLFRSLPSSPKVFSSLIQSS